VLKEFSLALDNGILGKAVVVVAMKPKEKWHGYSSWVLNLMVGTRVCGLFSHESVGVF